jgi:anaerobic selenocysteine-containing dehydrogenase
VSSRRDVIRDSAALLVGGVAGAGSRSVAAAAPAFAPAPPLPWKWTQLDPMEAGTRAYRSYLKNKG